MSKRRWNARLACVLVLLAKHSFKGLAALLFVTLAAIFATAPLLADALPPPLASDFVADENVVEMGDWVTFHNLTTGGTEPYTKAEWDFDGDGIPETIIEGSHAEVIADVAWIYLTLGIYTVILTMTDSTPMTSSLERLDYITVLHTTPWLNPHFVADKTEVEVGELIVFTNLTAGGTHPYMTAEWDFDADGIPEIIIRNLTGDITGEGMVMSDIYYTYSTPGVYTARLTMSDSTPVTGFEDRIDYITVIERVIWNCPIGGVALIAPNPMAGRPFLTVAVDPAEITVSAGAELWIILYLDETTGEWLYYIPGFVDNTLTLLEPDQYYYVVVSDACTLTIPQRT